MFESSIQNFLSWCSGADQKGIFMWTLLREAYMLTEHQNLNENFKCLNVGKVFKSLKNINNSMATVFKTQNFECKKCREDRNDIVTMRATC